MDYCFEDLRIWGYNLEYSDQFEMFASFTNIIDYLDSI